MADRSEKAQPTYEQAREIALRSLDAAPRSRAQLERKLASKGVDEQVACAVLDRLAEVGLVDDAAFARMLVASRQASSGMARRALAVELRRKGIDDQVAAEVLDTVDEAEESERARGLARRALARTTGLDDRVRVRRAVAMLGRKGYSAEHAVAVVREILQESAESDDDGGEVFAEGP